jgi:hypothetical protein
VKLTWTANAEPDLAGYYLYRQSRMTNPPPAAESLNGGQAWTGSPAVGFEDTAFDAQTRDDFYDYWVVPVDQAGRQGPSSVVVRARARDTAEPSPPVWQVPAIVEHETFLDLYWKTNAAAGIDPQADVVSYRLYRRTASGSFVESDLREAGILPGSSGVVHYADVGVVEATSYSYALKAVDATGNVSTDFSATASGTPRDLVPPGVPQGLVVEKTANAMELRVSWQANTEADLAGYRLTRKGPGQSGFTEVAGSPVSASALTLASLSAEGDYEFQVAALDADGNASAASAVAQGRPRVEFYGEPDRAGGGRA